MDERVTIHTGEALETLRTLADQSVHCICTSPPYYKLRDYGVDRQIGLEETPERFIDALVDVFHEARRVLRDDGVMFVNIGDSYAGGGNGGGGSFAADRANWRTVPARSGQRDAVAGLKPKDLIGIPWMLAFALRADGWYLRQEVIWHKPNPMPESVGDRFTKAHEQVFMLSKSERYWFDQDAVAEPATGQKPGNIKPTKGGEAYEAGADKMRTSANLHKIGARETRNKRDVWTIPTEPSTIPHFAMMPTELARICILAGCPEGGTVLDPFGGVGTSGVVAHRLHRNAVLIELNPVSVGHANDRLRADAGMFA